MRRTLALSITALVLAGCDRAPTAPVSSVRDASALSDALKPGDGPAARGAYTVIFGPNAEKIRFRARQAESGVVGRAVFNSRTARVRGVIDINCLVVVGNVARISGIVRRSSDPTIEGFEAVWQVQDNGKGKRDGGDLSSTILLHAVGTGSDCTVPGEFDMSPVRGHIDVVP